MSDSKNRSSDEGAEQDSSPGEERAGSLADLLGALLGGAGQGGSVPGSSGQEGGGLGALLGGAGQQGSALGSSGEQDSGLGGLGQGGSVLGSLLGTLLGGGGMGQQNSWGPQQQQQQQAGPGMGSSGDMLSALLGAGTGTGMNSGIASLLTPLITPLAQKLGIPVEIAQIVVVFVLGKLLSGKLGQGATSQAQAQYPSQSAPSGGMDLSGFLQQMSGGRAMDTRYLRSSGLTDELVQETGLDPDTAEQSLQEVLRMLSGQMGGAASPEMGAEQSRQDEGQAAIRRRTEDTGTEISGQVVDQRNGRGIGDVLVIALRPGIDVREFTRQPLREMAYTSVRTDADGRFTFPQRLPKGQAYGLVVVANGYRDLAIESALRIEPGMPEQAALNAIPLMPD
jgi:hypothetical protein